jgi:hypothetical protein
MNHRHHLLLIGLALGVWSSWVSGAHASDIVCGDASGLTGYQTSVDPSQVPPGCFLIAKEATASQRALYTETVQKRYLKVVDGLLVLKTAAEQAAVDAAIVQEVAALAVLSAAAAESVCTGTLASVASVLTADAAQVQGAIDAVTSVETAKAALTTLQTHVYALVQRLAQCVGVRTGGLQ